MGGYEFNQAAGDCKAQLPLARRTRTEHGSTSWGTGWWYPYKNFLKRNAENVAQDDDYDDDVDD